MDALCIGHACLDLIFAVDDYPAEDSKVLAARRSVSGGGPTANAAALLAYWGIDAGFAGPLGNDDLGTLVLSDFERFGVDTSLTVRCEGYPTPLSSIIAGSRTGSRTIVNHRSTEDIYRLPEQVSAPEILLFDGHALHASLDALERFPNVPSVLDADLSGKLPGRLQRRWTILLHPPHSPPLLWEGNLKERLISQEP